MTTTTTELARQMAERAAYAQDEAHVALRRSQAMSSTTSTPIDSDAEQRRAWALAEARANAGAQRLGGPARLMVFVNPDGSNNIKPDDPARPGVTQATTVHTDQPVISSGCSIWTEAQDEAWHAKVRRDENRLLAAHYDLAELVSAGIMSEAEAAHPLVAEAAKERPVRRTGQASDDYIERSVG